jgi:UDP-glucose 4-epimerase
MEGIHVIEKCAILGGAGFIGSNLIEALLDQGIQVLSVDNYCSGTFGHISKYLSNKNFDCVSLDISNTDSLSTLLKGFDTVVHLASNPDIARAQIEPRIDFVSGTALTESVMEASRKSRVKTVLYASGSGVYGDQGSTLLDEKSSLNPISTYGASKLAGEGLMAAYSHMFEVRTISFRFANVVGPNQTHGVGFDFLKKLKSNPKNLEILGDGLQSKPYVHVHDVISAMLIAESESVQISEIYNVSYQDTLSVNEIADLAVSACGLRVEEVDYTYSGGKRGWRADVPIVRLNSQKIEKIGWRPTYSSLDAMKNALEANLESC